MNPRRRREKKERILAELKAKAQLESVVPETPSEMPQDAVLGQTQPELPAEEETASNEPKMAVLDDLPEQVEETVKPKASTAKKPGRKPSK